MLNLYVANGDEFDNYGYGDGVGVGDEYGGFEWEGAICVCNICVGGVPDLSKGMACGYVVGSIVCVAICESFILGGIGGGWYGTWVVRGFCCLDFDDGRIDCTVFNICL